EAGALALVPAVSVWHRCFVASDTLMFYLAKLFWPFSLGPDYGRTPDWLLHHAWVYATVLVPLLLAVIAWRDRSKVWPTVVIVIFVVGVLPVSGFTPFTFQMYSTVADRYVYFVMLAPALALACALAELRGAGPRICGAVLIAGLTFVSIRQVPVWANTM